jgi:Domain of unknown function (DUF397)
MGDVVKSSFCGSASCIEVEFIEGEKLVIRETDVSLNGSYHNEFVTTQYSFAAFISGVKSGEFDHFIEGSHEDRSSLYPG